MVGNSGVLVRKAAILPVDNINTDVILPADFMITTSRWGLSRGLFHNWRSESNEKDFILNREEFGDVSSLVVGKNFGCGSSREHAVWALLESGIDTIFAPSFNETFANNAVKNGLAAIQFSETDINQISGMSFFEKPLTVEVDLLAGTACFQRVMIYKFILSPQQIETLVHGLNDISIASECFSAVKAHFRKTDSLRPWITRVSNVTL